MTAKPGPGPTKWLDALHTELLIEVQTLSINVEALKVDVPKLTAEILESAVNLQTTANKAKTDFEGMGHALIQVMKRNVEAEREASVLANSKAASATKTALVDFTKYFWLLAALSAVNVLLVAALLITRLAR